VSWKQPATSLASQQWWAFQCWLDPDSLGVVALMTPGNRNMIQMGKFFFPLLDICLGLVGCFVALLFEKLRHPQAAAVIGDLASFFCSLVCFLVLRMQG
jgi:hypothetical protein